jgi:hypothetical protein
MDEKFEDSKQKMVEGNEARYGKEARALYGDSVVDASNAKLMGLTIRQYRRVQELSNQINEKLEIACKQGDPSNPLAQEVCALHKEWLGFFWSHYSKEAHLVWHRCTWMTLASRLITMQSVQAAPNSCGTR